MIISLLLLSFSIAFSYQKPLSDWFAKEGDHYFNHFTLSGEGFTCETNDSFIEVKYLDDNAKHIGIILNEWKDHKKEGSPLFTVNSKTGVLQQLPGGTGVCWNQTFVYLKDGKEMILNEKSKCGPGMTDYETYEINTVGGVGIINSYSESKKDCFEYAYLKKPLESNKETIRFDFKYDITNPIENFNFWGWFTPNTSGGLNYLSGSAKMHFKIKDDYDYKYATIEVSENFALPPLQGKCVELYDDNFQGECKIQSPVWIDPADNDLTKYAPVRVFDIDFDGDDEIIIGTIDGNRWWHEYQIYELENTEKTLKAVPTISFRGDAEINKEFKTLTTRIDSNVCTSTVITYQSDGTGFKVMKKVERDYFDKDNPNKCITKVLDLETTKKVKD